MEPNALTIIHGIITLLSVTALGWVYKEVIAHGKELYHMSESCKRHMPVIENRLVALEEHRRKSEIALVEMRGDIKYIRIKVSNLPENVAEELKTKI